MAKKTVISKVLDPEAVDEILDFPKNKTIHRHGSRKTW